MIVPEKINFERTGDPIKSMGVGRQIMDEPIIKNTDWARPPEPEQFKIVGLIRDYRGMPILTLENKSFPLYTATSDNGIYSAHYESPHEAVHYVKRGIDEYLKKMYLDRDNTKRVYEESINFEKKDNPFDALKIGRIKWSNLVDFTILQAKKDVKRNSNNRISENSSYKTIEAGLYLRISDIQAYPDKNLSFTYYSYYSLAGAMGKSHHEISGNRMTYQEDGFIWGSIEELDDAFRILQPSELRESQNFERTGDPMRTLQIGQINRTDWAPKELFDAVIQEVKNSKNLQFKEVILIAKEPKITIESRDLAPSNKHDWVQKTFTFYLTEEGIVGFTEWNDDELELTNLKQFVELTDSRKIPRSIKEAQHFQRRGEPLDTLQVGRVVERRERKIHDEMKQAIKERMKRLGIKTRIKDESIEGKTDIRFYHEIWEYIFIHLYDEETNWDQYSVAYGIKGNAEPTSDILDYDTMEEALNKLDYWLFPVLRADKVTEEQNFERGQTPKKAMDIGMGKKFGKYFELFMEIYELAKENPKFEVSKIEWPEGMVSPIWPVFTIQSSQRYIFRDLNMNRQLANESFRVTCGNAGIYLLEKSSQTEKSLWSIDEFKVLTGYES